MELICPRCLDDYQFVDFDVDPRTLEHRGIFKCSCSQRVLFPERYVRVLVDDEDVLERLRISRLMALERSRQEPRTPSPGEADLEMFSASNKKLMRYLRDFSDRSVRLLKAGTGEGA